ncbi:enoyl-CoA hydratase-related protein [Mycobacterium sp. MUNTM1]
MIGRDATGDTAPLILLDVRGGVAVITLNRPQRHNGWTPELEAHYFATLEDVDRDPDVRVIVVTGAGTAFCPGVDTGRLDQIAGQPMDVSERRSPATPWAVRKPMIAAINGACAGMGLVQALLCDVRFAARGSRFSTAFARRGLAGEYGITWLLPRLIGTGNSADLLLSARTFDAEEAHRLGVVNWVTEPHVLMGTVLAYAADMAKSCSPMSMGLIRHQLHLDEQSNFDGSLRRAYRAMSFSSSGSDFREGVSSFLEKRSPNFPGLAERADPSTVTGAALPEIDLTPNEVVPTRP